MTYRVNPGHGINYDTSCWSLLHQFLRWLIVPLVVEVVRPNLRHAAPHLVFFCIMDKDRVLVSNFSAGSITAKIYHKGKINMSFADEIYIKKQGFLQGLFSVWFISLFVEKY